MQRFSGPLLLAMIRRLGLDLIAPVICGGLLTLGFAPFGYWPLTLLSLIGLVALWWHASIGRAAGRGFIFGLGYFGTGLYWPYVAIHSFGHAPAPLAGGLIALLVAYLALYPAMVGALAGATRRVPRPIWALVLVPGFWLLSELARGRVGTGMPWLSLGYSLIDSPASKLAPVIGVYGLSLVLVVAAGVLCLLFAGTLASRVLAAFLIALTPVALWAVPAPGHWTRPAGRALSASIVQGDFGEAIKTQPSSLSLELSRYEKLTAHTNADLVIWPETALPVPADRIRPYLNHLGAMARSKQQTILTGTLVPHHQTYYNAVISLGKGHGHYYKRHLVPFGEYYPVPDFVKHWMDALKIRYGGLAFGPQKQAPIHVDGVDIGVSICFEDVFPREIAKALPAASILVNVTNDAWFAGTIGPAQHLQIARMRALEAGRPMLRAANTGISAIIGYAGHARQTTPQFKVATLNSPKVQPREGMTPFVALGNAPFWWASGLITFVGLIGACIIRRRHR